MESVGYISNVKIIAINFDIAADKKYLYPN